MKEEGVIAINLGFLWGLIQEHKKTFRGRTLILLKDLEQVVKRALFMNKKLMGIHPTSLYHGIISLMITNYEQAGKDGGTLYHKIGRS